MTEERKVKFTRKRLTSLRRGQNVFKATGISEIKVTHAEQDENGEYYQVVECLEIPIKSTGITELVDAFNEKAPIPPTTNVLVQPESEMGKSLGLKKKEWIKIFDTTDADYVKKIEDHRSKMGIAIVVNGLDMALEDEQGNAISDSDEKIKILREMGLSGQQFSKLVEDITALTNWSQKEREDFLG